MANGKKGLGVVFTVLISLGLVVTGCGGGGSPGDVAKAFYKAGNEGNYAQAEGYLASEARMVFKIDPTMGKFDNAMDAVTKRGTITRIVLEEGVEYADVSATVMVTLHYADGSQKSDVLQMMKQDGKWKIFMSSLLIMGTVR